MAGGDTGLQRESCDRGQGWVLWGLLLEWGDLGFEQFFGFSV